MFDFCAVEKNDKLYDSFYFAKQFLKATLIDGFSVSQPVPTYCTLKKCA